MDSLGKRLVRALIEEKEAGALSENRISAADLFEDGKTSFEWVMEFVRAHGDWPSKKIGEENCKIELPEEADPLGYI